MINSSGKPKTFAFSYARQLTVRAGGAGEIRHFAGNGLNAPGAGGDFRII